MRPLHPSPLFRFMREPGHRLREEGLTFPRVVMAKSSAASSSWGAPGGSIVGLPASYSRADERITVHSGTHTNLVVSPVQSYRIFHATYNSPCLLCDSPFALDSVVVETVGEGSFGK